MAAMAARTTPTPTPVEADVDEYDFDGWTEEAEDAALLELNDVKYIIVEGTFVGRFADRTIVKIPLQLSLGMINELEVSFPKPIDQFQHLIRTFTGDDLVERLDTQGLIPVAIMAEKYFRCLSRAQELAFPES